MVFFLAVTTRLSCKTTCTITNKQHICEFLFLGKIIQQVGVGLALFTVVETGFFVGWKVNKLFVWACWTIHISNCNLNWFLRHFENVNPLAKLHKKRTFLFFKMNFAKLTRGRGLRTLTVTSADRLKKIFVHKNYIWTHYTLTKHVPNIFTNAIVISRIKRQSATHRNFSQLFHFCLHVTTVLVEVLNSLRTLQCSTVDQFLCTKKNSAIPLLQLGSASTFQYWYQFRPTW